MPMTLWPDLTWPELKDAASRTCFMPLGAIEQHGPHLPLSTDVVIPERIVQAAADRVDGLVLPILPFGARSRPRTGGGARFPGGLFLENETLSQAVSSLARDVIAAGARRLIVLTWHYENSHPVWDGCRRAHLSAPDVRIVLVDSPGDLLPMNQFIASYPGEFPGWAAEHAAVVETSLMMYLEPRLVREQLIPSDRPPTPEPDMVLPESGVFAPAAAATPEFGKDLFEMIVERLVSLAE
jgi:creatinine amidohydrolase